ncbi:hypothetical protein EJB05_00357, partial [Eragrostis curvula]
MDRRRNIEKAAAGVVPAPCVDDIPEDLLEVILRRLDSPICLIRAASTCKRWRGIIVADDDGVAFLRRARTLHPHPRTSTIVGHYHQRATTIEFIPTSPIDPSRFSLDFLLPLGETAKWELKDCHGGLVLLLQLIEPRYLVVCDPLTRWYRKLNVSTRRRDQLNGNFFLIEGEDGSAISGTNFRVFYRFHDVNAIRSCVFSTAGDDRGAGGGWCAVPPSKDDTKTEQVSLAGRVEGSLYMGTECGRLMDTSEFACAFLLNGEEEDISISNFRVFVRFFEGPRACVFSTADAGGGWRFLWRSEDDLDSECDALLADRVDGSVYFWTICGCVLQLVDDDDANYDFAEADLPSRVDMSRGYYSTYGIVESSRSPSRPCIVHVYLDELEVFGRRDHGEWVLEHSIHRLSEATPGAAG